METDITRRLLLKALLAALTVELCRPTGALAKDGGDDGGGGGGGSGGDDGGDDGDDGGDDGGKGRGRGRGRGRGGDDDDDDRADKSSRTSGDSLRRALKNVRLRYPGRIVDVELSRYRGRRVYEIKVIDNRGRLLNVYCDITSGSILKVGKG